MASDANVSIPSDAKQFIKSNASDGEGSLQTPTARDGFLAQVSGNPFFTAVLDCIPMIGHEC